MGMKIYSTKPGQKFRAGCNVWRLKLWEGNYGYCELIHGASGCWAATPAGKIERFIREEIIRYPNLRNYNLSEIIRQCNE